MSDICHMTRKGNLPLDSMCSCVGMCKRSSPKYKEEAYFDPEKMEEAEITYWKETFPAQAESIGDFYKRKLVETGEKALDWKVAAETNWAEKEEKLRRESLEQTQDRLTKELVEYHSTRPMSEVGRPNAVTISERKHAELKNAKRILFKNYRSMEALVAKYREANLPVSSEGMDFFDWVEQNLDWAAAMRELFKKGAE